MPKKYRGEKIDTQILENRYFNVSELRETLRRLKMGIDNAEFRRLWEEEVIKPPQVVEPWAVMWKYKDALQLVKDVYELKGKPDEFDVYETDLALTYIKELKRYGRYVVDTLSSGKQPAY